MLKIFQKIAEIGINKDLHHSDKRSILLTNYISLILIIRELLLFLTVSNSLKLDVLPNILFELFIISLPLVINYFRLYTISKLTLSWGAIFLITSDMIHGMQLIDTVPVSDYLGLRMYLISFGCIPLLIFNLNKPLKLITGIAPSLLTLIFFESFLEFFDVGYNQVGAEDLKYDRSFSRSIFAYGTVSLACITLRYLVDQNDSFNQKLIKELNEKNQLIEQQSEQNLAVVNSELEDTIQNLRKSQHVAKIGSWKFGLDEKFNFWSDEMFNIFDLDKNSTDLRKLTFKDIAGEAGEKFYHATKGLIAKQGGYQVTIKIKTIIGSSKWIKVYASGVLDNNKLVGVTGIAHDVTKEKESEILLKSSESKYKRLFEQSFYSILLIDELGKITDANKSFCDLILQEKSDFYQKQLGEVINFYDSRINAIERLDVTDHIQTQGSLITLRGKNIILDINIKSYDGVHHIVTLRDITEIKAAQSKLLESEVKFRTSFEASAIGMALISIEGHYLEVNSKLSEILGYKTDELSDLKFKNITYTQDLEEDLELFYQTLEGKITNYTREKRYVHKSGALIWANVSVALIRDNQGLPLYFISQVEDINDRKNAELDLIEAETKFRTLVEQSLVGVYIINDKTFEYVNDAFCEMVKSNPEDIYRSEILDFVYSEDRPIVTNNIKEHYEKDIKSVNYEFRGVRKNGEVFWVEVYGTIINYRNEKRIIGSIIDINDHKEFEKEQALNSSILSSIEEAIITITPNNKITSWNKGAKRIFGKKFKEVNKKSINTIFKDAGFSITPKLSKSLEEQVAQQGIEKHIKTKKKDLYISISIYPLTNKHKELIGATVIARDITFKKETTLILEEKEEYSRTLVENAPEALVVFDLEDKKFVSVSKSATKLFKMSEEELLRHNPYSLSPPIQPDGSSSETSFEHVKEAVKNGESFFEWNHMDSRGNEIPCEVTLVRLPSKDRTLVRGSIVDISKRIQRDKELAEANKKIGELKLVALRSVMSPHFIFNVLNSIQYFIGKNDRLNAINYLSTFSKLIRSILTHSVDNKIKLSDEIEMLKNYVNLEMLRFEDKFDFEVILDDNLEIDYIEIPSLLIQPYVENAILHGLYNKPEKGKLTIEVQEKGDMVYFKIEDNGIGRDAAKKLSKKNFPKHKSMGLKVTEERLKLINENKNITFYIEDLMDRDQPSGTRVTVGIMN